MKPFFRLSVLGVLSLAPLAPLSAVSYSETLGVVRVEFAGEGRFNFVSSPFLPSAAFRSQIEAVEGAVVTLAAAPPAGLGNGHYLEVRIERADEPPRSVVVDIAGANGAVLTMAEDLTGIALPGDAVVIRRIPTVDSILGADNRFGFDAWDANDDPLNPVYDFIYVTVPGSGRVAKLFYADFPDANPQIDYTGWKDASDFVTPLGSLPIYPETGLYAKVAGPSVEVTFVGEVCETAPQVAVIPGMNVLAVFNPLSAVLPNGDSRKLTLGNCGFVTGDPNTGIRPDVGDGTNDRVLLPSLTSPGTLDAYVYYEGFGWYELGSITGLPADDRPIETGTAVVVMRFDPTPGSGPSGPDFAWDQPNLHLPVAAP